MNRFISFIDQTLRSLAGCSVEFKAGEPTYVPPQAHAEAIAAGCVPAATYVPIAPPKTPYPGPDAPVDPIAPLELVPIEPAALESPADPVA